MPQHSSALLLCQVGTVTCCPAAVNQSLPVHHSAAVLTSDASCAFFCLDGDCVLHRPQHRPGPFPKDDRYSRHGKHHWCVLQVPCCSSGHGRVLTSCPGFPSLLIPARCTALPAAPQLPGVPRWTVETHPQASCMQQVSRAVCTAVSHGLLRRAVMHHPGHPFLIRPLTLASSASHSLNPPHKTAAYMPHQSVLGAGVSFMVSVSAGRQSGVRAPPSKPAAAQFLMTTFNPMSQQTHHVHHHSVPPSTLSTATLPAPMTLAPRKLHRLASALQQRLPVGHNRALYILTVLTS